MSFDLILKPCCDNCRKTVDLYGSNCKHLTLCMTCGKSMAEHRRQCHLCGALLTRLIREYNVRPSTSVDKNFFIGRFPSGLPKFKKSSENKWTLIKEGLQNRQVTDSLREKFKNKPWLLEDETGQSQYHGHMEGAQSATYYLLVLQGQQAKEFDAIPAGSWYNFNKVAQYKQLTLEEAEEKMKNRRRTADGYERWMMKAANNPTAFAHVVKEELGKDAGVSGAAGGRGRKKSTDEDEGNASDKGEMDEEAEAARKARLGLDKRGGDDDEDEGPGDNDDDDDDIEKGDDWEHEEIFTDDDEAVGNDPEEREDLFAPEIPAPPEIKEDDDEDEETNENGEGLSKSGIELKRLLKASGLNDPDVDNEDDSSKRIKEEDDDDDDDDDMDDEDRPVSATKLKDPKKELDNSPTKSAPGGSSRGTQPSKSSKGKRKSGEDAKPGTSAPSKKVKTENEVKPSSKQDGTKAAGASKGAPPPSSVKTESSSSAQGPVSEEEIRAVLLQRAPLTTNELVGTFKARLQNPEDKKAFAEILKRISKIQKSSNGQSFVVFRGKK